MIVARRVLTYAVISLSLVLLGAVLGRYMRPVVVPMKIDETKKEKATAKWEEKKAEASATTATAATTANTKTKRKWFRKDGSVAKEETRETGSIATATSTTASTEARQSAGQVDRASESRTVSVPVVMRPRFQAQAYLGLDLGAGAARRWGGAVSARIAGPLTVGAFAMPGMRLYGAAIGVTF